MGMYAAESAARADQIPDAPNTDSTTQPQATTAQSAENSSESSKADTEKQEVLLIHPLADLTRINIENWFTPDEKLFSGNGGYTVALRGFWAHQIGAVNQLSRLTIPYIVQSPSTGASGGTTGDLTDTPRGPKGLGDIELYSVGEFGHGPGKIKLGPTFSFPTATEDTGSQKWSAGPAGGYAWGDDRVQVGFFTQSLFSFAGNSDAPDVGKTKIQPILLFSLSHDWAVGLSEMNFTYDWQKGAWTSIPIGVQLAKLIHVGREPINLVGQAEYNLSDHNNGPAWTVRFTMSFLAPGK
jgi:hypothetical protein